MRPPIFFVASQLGAPGKAPRLAPGSRDELDDGTLTSVLRDERLLDESGFRNPDTHAAVFEKADLCIVVPSGPMTFSVLASGNAQTGLATRQNTR